MTEELPPGWERTTLGAVFEIVGGSTPRTDEPSYWGGDIPWLTPDDLARHDGVEVAGGRRSISHAGYCSTSTHLLPKGAILYSSRAPIGYAAIASQPLCTNQGFKSLIPPEGVDSKYVYWYLCHATPTIREMGSGTTFKEISKKRMAAVPFVLAPWSEQQGIVAAIEEHFSRLEATETACLAAQQKADALLRAVVGEVCHGSWESVPLAEVITSLRNGIFVSRPAAEPPGRPIYRISAVRPLRLRIDDVRYALPEPKAAEDYAVNPGDVLFTRYSGNPSYVGAAASVPDAGSGVLHPDKLIRVVVDRAQVLPEWLAAYVSVGEGRRQVEMRLKTTAGQVGISGSQLKGVPIAVPPIDYQRAAALSIAGVMDNQDRIEQQLAALRAKSSTLRRSILASAFAGRLLQQDLGDESAAVLAR